MLDLVWLIPALPLFGFLVLAAAGRRIGEPTAGYLATLCVGASFVVAQQVLRDGALLIEAKVKIAALAASTFRPRAIPDLLQSELKKNLLESA